MASVRSTFRSTGVAIRLTLLSTVVLGVLGVRSGVATDEAMVSGLAPGSEADTEMVG